MRDTLLRFAAAGVLALGAWLCWAEARFIDRVGEAKEQIASLHFADVPAELGAGATLSDYLPADRRLTDDVRVATATVSYWLGRYESVTADTGNVEADAEVLLLAANAAFRAAQRDPSAGPAAVQQLDGVLNAYASALKAAPNGAGASGMSAAKTAAYNYEYVARLRDQAARSQGKASKAAPLLAVEAAGDLPAGPTIHGRPGAPPPEARMEDLKMLAPMEYGDREAQPEATPGGKRDRKG